MTEFLSLMPPDFNKREIMRYARSSDMDELSAALDDCIAMSGGVLNYNVVFCELKFTIIGDVCDFGAFSVKSLSLSKNLSDSSYIR